ncbi:MAG: hypothetical protein Q7S53_02630 [bacterium]|nr:hypothetical protein [bacterium]
MKNIKLKKRILGVVSMLALAVAVLVPIAANPKTADAWECHAQNVINCGVNDKTNMINQINNGDGVHTDLKSMFGNMGIYTEDLGNKNTLGGVVTRDGRVLLANGQQVASGVVIGERQTAGRTGTQWQGLIWNFIPNAFAPAVTQQGAYVYMYNGEFQYAIVMSCGNPVLKSLRAVPPHTTISKEVRNVTQNPTGTTYSETVSANPGDVVRFRIRVYNNSTVTAQLVHIGDTLPNYLTIEPGSAQTTTQQLSGTTWQAVTANISDTEAIHGRNIGSLIPNQDAYMVFNARVSNGVPSGCHTLVNTGFTDSDHTNPVTDTANVNVCVQGPPPPIPPTPPVTPPTVTPSQPTSLPVSGPVEAAGGVMGTAGLGYAGYLWRRSRKTLLGALKSK